MINRELIISKLANIQNYLQELKLILQHSSREIIEDNLKLHTVERLFQLIVDSAIDINTHLITTTEATVPSDYQSTFITLGEQKILDSDFALKIAPSVGLRNLIIHQYGKVDLKRVVDDVKSEIDQYVEYLKMIRKYIDQP